MIAAAAGRDHIGPIFPTAFTCGNDVIQRELFRGVRFSAVLASVVISAVDVFATEFDSAQAALVDVALKS